MSEEKVAKVTKEELKLFQKASISNELSDACIKHKRDRKAWKYRMKGFKYSGKAWKLFHARLPEVVEDIGLRVNNVTGVVTKVAKVDE